jgi:hypothetical protein
MIRQSFYQLPRIIQERFIAASAGYSPPTPILALDLPPPRTPFYWLAGSAVCALVAVGVLGFGYGDLTQTWAIAPPVAIAVYSVLLALCLWCAFAAWASHQANAAIPYRRGRFVFPSNLVDSSSPVFRVYPLSELNSVDVVDGSRVVLVFREGFRARFETASNEAASLARDTIVSAKRALIELEIEGRDADGRELSRLNPLLEPRYSNPLSSRQSMTEPVPRFRYWAMLGASLLGLALGVGLFTVRNTLSERRLFARAVAENTASAYRNYLDRGGKRPEVNALLLPRAELAELMQRGDLAELEAYARENANSPIRAELDAAVRLRLLEALSAATKQRTLGALDAFREQHAAAAPLVQTELRAARRDIVAEAFERFAPRAAETAGLVPFMKAILAHVVEHGPLMEVRFHRAVSESVARADELVRNDKYFRPSQVPSQYFEQTRLEPWLERIFQRIYKGFGLIFPTDILNVKRGEPLAGDDLPASLEVPTLAISFSTNMGRGISNRNPGGMFFGVGFLFRARLVLAGKEPLELRYSTWRPPDLLKLREGKISVAEVYERMAEDAFKGFDNKLGLWLFKR